MTTFCEDNFIACFKSTNMSQMFMQLLLALVWGLAVMMLLGDAQRSDFISIDCGLRQDFSYTDGLTTITYIPDTDFIDTGERKSISSDYIDEFSQPFRSLRSFPEGTRNCYKMNINSGQKYLIRASFVYGNYDGQNNLPEFELHLGASLWESVVILMPYKRIVKELIHIPMQNYIQICMVNIGKGAPFISVIELRRLHHEIYQTEVRSLALLYRRSLKMNETGYRYPDDVNDRIWITEFFDDLKELNTSSVIDPDQTAYQLPSAVMSSAATPGDNSTKYLEISWHGETKGVCYMYMHFAEVQDRNSSPSRELTITINGDIINYKPLEPQYLSTTTINATIAAEQGPYYNISLVISTPAAKMDQPFLNAYELYMAKDFLVPETNQQDIEAITNLKSSYKIIKNWQGDPCNPQKYLWEGVKCSYSDHDSSRIISLDLSSSGLSGEIADSIANLTMIETLDLSNNNLSGQIPEYFSQLRKLHILNLEQNELTGLVPGGLSAKTGDGLSLSLCGNPSLSPHVPCEKKKNTSRPVVVVPIVGLLFVIIVTGAIVWKCQQKHKQQNHGTYDVFLSFRGEDTRNTIISYLRDALIREKINPFLDQDNLKIGAEIKPSLVSAIQASKMAIIIFSETYVSSAWCLNELVTILECKQHRQLVVFPFFYKVAPTDVRHQSQHFLLDESIYHDQEHKDMFPQWRKALTEVANLAGKTYNNDGSEATMIDDIVKETLKIVGKQQE